MNSGPHVAQQPDDESCGITCLKAIYDHYAHPTTFAQLKHEIGHWRTGGTSAVNLGLHALGRGFDAEAYAYNLEIFDPSWKSLPPAGMSRKLGMRRKHARRGRPRAVIGLYREFLKRGGKVRLDELDEGLMDRLFRRRVPLICGVSATYLYREPRETHDNRDDDVAGHPVGHFVVAIGWDARARTVDIRDPMRKTPLSRNGAYRLPFARFSNAVMLAALTCDDNLLAIAKRKT